MAIASNIGELIGNTPILRLRRYEAALGCCGKLFAKLESFNPAGSAKDRVARCMLDGAEKKGLLKPGGVVIEPTSGNTGIGLAALGVSRGYRVILTMPDNMSQERQMLPVSDILIPGRHNVEYSMAAVCAVEGLVPDDTIREFARTFGGVEHRIELVRQRRGVRWYNDSIASSPSRTIAGLLSFPQPVILIAGGKDKGVSYEPLGPVINDHAKLLILCGATAGAIRKAVTEAENYRGMPSLEVED